MGSEIIDEEQRPKTRTLWNYAGYRQLRAFSSHTPTFKEQRLRKATTHLQYVGLLRAFPVWLGEADERFVQI